MKKTLLLAACVLLACAANAQSVTIAEKHGFIVTQEKSSYYLENKNSYPMRVTVVNCQNRVEELPGGIIGVNESGEHGNRSFVIGAKTKTYLSRFTCSHSKQLKIGKETLPLVSPEKG